jgi:tetratricopeptide (TPR) repeat protein
MATQHRTTTVQALAWALLLALSFGCVYSDDDDDRTEGAATAPPITAQATIEAPGKVELGKRLVKEGAYEEAIVAFTSALEEARKSNLLAKANEDEAAVYFQRGIAYLRSGFPDTAERDFSDAINLMPNDGAMYERRAQAHLELGDSYNALSDATQAIRLKPNNAAAYRLRGEVYLRRDRPERAVADLEQALESDPTLAPTIQASLAQAYARWSDQLSAAGDKGAAAEKLAKAQELDPTITESAGESGVAEAEAPAPAAEQTVAKPVIDDSIHEFQSGRENQLAEAYDQAVIDYTEAIALRSDYHEAYLRRGETLLAMGFPDSALEDLRRATNRGAATAEVHRLQAQAHMALKNPNRAAMSATDALQVDPTHAETYALRGEAYLQMENWDRAIADLQEAIRRSPELRASLQGKLSAARRELAKSQASNLQAASGG